MKLKELWDVTPAAHIFIKSNDRVEEYLGDKAMGERTVSRIKIKPVRYPMFPNSLEVTLNEMKGDI